MPSSKTDSKIILITGIMAAGKSTVAQRLAEHFPKSVHLRGDIFRRMMVRGRLEMQPPLSEEALTQLRLRYRLAAVAADMYRAAGFTVIYQDVILGPVLAEVVSLFERRPLYVVVLCPSPSVMAEREAARSKTGYALWSVAELDHALRYETPRIGMWLDTSTLTVDETVSAILAELEQAAVERAY